MNIKSRSERQIYLQKKKKDPFLKKERNFPNENCLSVLSIFSKVSKV